MLREPPQGRVARPAQDQARFLERGGDESLVREVDGAVRMPQTGVPQDVTGYDEAMRSFAPDKDTFRVAKATD